MATPLALRLIGLSKSFAGVAAVRDLSLETAPGELIALLGPSGCGKTTTLRMIAGFEPPDSGRIVIGARDVTALPPNKRGLGMVFQNYSLFPHMTVGENVAFGLRMQRLPIADRTRRARDMLQLVRLNAFEERQVHQLSGGQQQRVALARSLVTNPSVLLLDEPLGALDRNLREGMQFELRELQRRLAITSVLVTHDQEEALTMADRVAVMSAGEIVQIDAPGAIYARPRTRFVSEFLGTANIFTGTATATGRVALDLPGRPSCDAVGAEQGRTVMLALRPERVALCPPGKGIVDATLRDLVFRGSYHACELTVAGRDQPIFAYLHTEQPGVAPGATVGLAWSDAVVLEDRPE
jgi:ABC-type Fe3+/spermidine/putrescine transport system ATPase subunit